MECHGLPLDDQSRFEREWEGRPEELKQWRIQQNIKQIEENKELKAKFPFLPDFFFIATTKAGESPEFKQFLEGNDATAAIIFELPSYLLNLRK